MWPTGDMARCVLLRIRRTHADALMWGLRDASLQFRAQRYLDGPLLYGSALFGIGWGLVGRCMAPVLPSAAALRPSRLMFVVGS